MCMRVRNGESEFDSRERERESREREIGEGLNW